MRLENQQNPQQAQPAAKLLTVERLAATAAWSEGRYLAIGRHRPADIPELLADAHASRALLRQCAAAMRAAADEYDLVADAWSEFAPNYAIRLEWCADQLVNALAALAAAGISVPEQEAGRGER